jgi:uncharacterized protein YjiS (DUF1127 family)
MWTTASIIPGIEGPGALPELDSLAPLADLASLPADLKRTLTASFGRIARTYPARVSMAARSPRQARSPLARDGLASATARLVGHLARRLAEAAAERAEQWARQRQRRLTERALIHLDARTLHDIGFARSEISSVALEVSEPVRGDTARRSLRSARA